MGRGERKGWTDIVTGGGKKGKGVHWAKLERVILEPHLLFLHLAFFDGEERGKEGGKCREGILKGRKKKKFSSAPFLVVAYNFFPFPRDHKRDKQGGARRKGKRKKEYGNSQCYSMVLWASQSEEQERGRGTKTPSHRGGEKLVQWFAHDSPLTFHSKPA